ncbi:MAG: glycosyltransferase family 4 protein [Acidobacteriota bacterium]|nr:glycosyltransferase family 4 protein [Acidobacteriota bacterium]
MSSAPARGANGSVDLAVLVHEFPKLSETFVLADLLALEERGVRLHVFSLRRPAADLLQDGDSPLRAPVEYLPEIAGRQRTLLTRALHARMLARAPARYAAGLAEIYASPDYSKLRLTQAALLAGGLLRLGTPPLYIHFAHKPATVGRFASLMLGTPFAISAHAVDVWATPPKELRAKLRDASVVLACYEEAQRHLERLAGGHAPVLLARHGVEIPASWSRAEATPPIVLAVGRLVEKKGFDTLLQAVASIGDGVPEFRLHIAGDGPLWPVLARLTGELGLREVVRFLGPLTHSELERHFASAAVFALPCRVAADGNRDGLPNTILEAMARELPVVSTTLPSVREAISDGVEGRLVPPGEPEPLAAALRELLCDAQLRRRLGAAARQRVVREHDREAMAPLVHTALAEAGLLDGLAG